jgi:Tol biopolymer transport system component/DNA-binding winged helix-turn-helix (wHTH) protein
MNREAHSVYEFGEFRLDPHKRVLTRAGGERIALTAKAFDALVHLIEHAGEVVTRTALNEALWPTTVVEENNLSQAISALRRALGEDHVATVSRRGYQFTADVRVVRAETQARDAAPAWKDPQDTVDASRHAANGTVFKRPIVTAVAGGAVLAAAVLGWSTYRGGDFPDPLHRYSFTKLTEFEGAEEHAAISRDGRHAAFLRESNGVWDAWIGQIDSGDFQKLTDGTMRELRNPAVRTLGFSPDGSRVLIWTRSNDPGGGVVDGGWTVPVVGGVLQPWFRGVAELDWSPDGKRIVYHTAEPGDPLFVANADDRSDSRQIYVAPNGVHCHFPVWSRDGETIYFVKGGVPNEMDVWRVRASGGEPERLTFHNARVLSPTLLDDRTLLYLATAEDGSGPWMHALDLERGLSRRLNTSGQAYTSISAAADGARLVGTVVQSTTALWRVPIVDPPAGPDRATRLAIDTPRALAPRIGPGFLVYRAPRAGNDGLWMLADGQTTELWNGAEGRVAGGAALSPDGRRVAFPVQRPAGVQLYVMNVDGTGARRIAEGLDVRGAPAWSPDGSRIAIAAIDVDSPRLFSVPADGGAPVRLGDVYAVDPVWSPGGDFIVFSGPDVGTNYSIGAVGADGKPRVVAPLVLSRGSRRLAFLSERELVVLKGDMSYKEFWAVDLVTGAGRQLTTLGAGPAIVDFDVSPDGSELVFDRVREESDVMLIDLTRRDRGR